jgi:hypothetical protein
VIRLPLCLIWPGGCPSTSAVNCRLQ